MPFRTLLSIAGENTGNEDLKLAAGLCEEIGAHLSVVVVAMAAPPPIGQVAAMLSDDWLEERQGDLARLSARADDISKLLNRMSISADLTCEYQEQAWTDEAIGRRARYVDLTVLGPGLLARNLLREKAAEGALFHSGKPLLLVPAEAKPTLTPKRVMVAWDASLEATRAVREALDILAGSEEVRVAIVDPVESAFGHGEEPGADVAAFLARHGAKVIVDRLPSEDRSIAEVLRRHSADCAAEMLVMGAYGHSRLRQRMLGGVTRSMLEEPPLPILMAR